jgi:hypothetical protein
MNHLIYILATTRARERDIFEVKMKIYKEKQFLIFDFGNGKTVKYDFATKKSYGFSGKEVKNLRSQLRNIGIYQLEQSCINKNYVDFFRFVCHKAPCYSNNIGTILNYVPNYSDFEFLFLAGIKMDLNLTYDARDIPRALVKLCIDKEFELSDFVIKSYKENPNAMLLVSNLSYNSLGNRELYEALFYPYYGHNEKTVFNILTKQMGYSAKALLRYIDRLATFEAIDDVEFIMRELLDYSRMMQENGNKFDKYPKYFLTTLKIATRNYNRLKKNFSEELFKSRIDKSLEMSYKDYRFIYPCCIDDIKDEAAQQNNCVASYIDRVLDGKCHILFLRNKDSIDKSLVTLEVRHNEIVQAKRKFNYAVSAEEQEAIDEWNKRHSA